MRKYQLQIVCLVNNIPMLSKEANDFEPIFSAAVTAPSGKDGPVEGKRRMIVDCAMEV